MTAAAPLALPPRRAIALPEPAPARTGVLRPSASLPLEHGGVLHDARIGWRLHGDAGRPLVVVLGGISADRHVAACDDQPHAGWWQPMIGRGRPVDLDGVCVLGVDWLGGFGASTGPRAGEDFPVVGSRDQADAIALVLDALGVATADAVVGASYGAMVALALAARHPARVGRVVAISGAHGTHPFATALRSVQRRTVRLGLASGTARRSLELARALAMVTYRSAEEFAARFDGAPSWTADGPRFPVEDYLLHAGATFADRCPPESFLCLSTSIDLHRVDPAAITAPTTLVAVDGDLLVPPGQMRELHASLAGPAALHEIPSPYGHDAFLKEIDAIGGIVADALASSR